jgi:hypothetical protein
MAFVSARSFDNGGFMLQMLGTLWSIWYKEHDELAGLMTARGEPFYQVYLGILDLLANKSRFNVPVFKTQQWYLFTLKASQRDEGAQLANQYSDTGLTYQEADKPAYGDKANLKHYAYALAPGIVQVHAVYNRVINPSLIWMAGADFSVDGDRGIISFYTDPFQDPLVPKRDVLDANGNVIDQEIALWFSLASIDIQNVYTQFGYALGVWMKSSTYYREFISAIWDLLILGPTQLALKTAFSALTGIPFAEGGETVRKIIDESPYFKHVQTDKNLYTFKAGATILVSVGDVLVSGELMTSSLVIYEPDVNSPDASAFGFKGFSIQDTLMNPVGLKGPVIFEDAEVSVSYLGLDANNKAIVQFAVSGFPSDVDAFWRRSHQEGLKTGKTMASLLDTRVVQDTPTTPADLPTTINPFNFVLDHIFVNNLYLIYIEPQNFASDSPGLGSLDMLYPYLSPHTAYMIYVDTDAGHDYYDMGDAQDTLSFWRGRGISDTVPNVINDLGCVIRAIPGRCR